jgi:hypothetical protein
MSRKTSSGSITISSKPEKPLTEEELVIILKGNGWRCLGIPTLRCSNCKCNKYKTVTGAGSFLCHSKLKEVYDEDIQLNKKLKAIME